MSDSRPPDETAHTIYYEREGGIDSIDHVVDYEVSMPWVEYTIDYDGSPQEETGRIPFDRVVRVDDWV